MLTTIKVLFSSVLAIYAARLLLKAFLIKYATFFYFMRKIALIIERMKQVTSCNTDTELIKYLGLKSAGSISTWKARNRIPYPECDSISQRENVDLDYLIKGKTSSNLELNKETSIDKNNINK